MVQWVGKVFGIVLGIGLGLLVLAIFNWLWVTAPGVILFGGAYLIWRKRRAQM